ncbi:MAG: hypothetical protein CME70_06025 [Halobacteriovorax sp.]|nr:hypothetical protein [Halobacteriovorax sp.]|tara:strand:- start:169 stop:561 length:393 start_codon:yes stop_codon:yes gene_type:complete
MALVTDNWDLQTISSKKVNLTLSDNQASSSWEITSFSIDAGPDVKDQVAGTTGTHDINGRGTYGLVLADVISLSGSGTVTLGIEGIDADAENFSTFIDFFYTVPVLNRMRLMGTGGIVRARFISGKDDDS